MGIVDGLTALYIHRACGPQPSTQVQLYHAIQVSASEACLDHGYYVVVHGDPDDPGNFCDLNGVSRCSGAIATDASLGLCRRSRWHARSERKRAKPNKNRRTWEPFDDYGVVRRVGWTQKKNEKKGTLAPGRPRDPLLSVPDNSLCPVLCPPSFKISSSG